MTIEQEIARIHRLELTGVISWLEAQAFEAALHGDKPTSLVHALGRLQLLDLQARFLLLLDSHDRAMHDDARKDCLPSSRDQLVAAILDRVS